MAAADVSRLLRWYPPAWRERYGDEFLVFMRDSFGSDKPPLAARLSIVAGGIRERARRSGLSGDSVPPADRIRAGMAVAVALAVVGILAATSLWWALIGERAPTFLSGDPASPINAWLVAAVAVMALAAVAATAGAARIAQSLPEWVRN